jgi:hypothetical protein
MTAKKSRPRARKPARHPVRKAVRRAHPKALAAARAVLKERLAGVAAIGLGRSPSGRWRIEVRLQAGGPDLRLPRSVLGFPVHVERVGRVSARANPRRLLRLTAVDASMAPRGRGRRNPRRTGVLDLDHPGSGWVA